MQSAGDSFKSLGDSVIDLTKKTDPFKTLSDLLSRSLKEMKGASVNIITGRFWSLLKYSQQESFSASFEKWTSHLFLQEKL